MCEICDNLKREGFVYYDYLVLFALGFLYDWGPWCLSTILVVHVLEPT
jgi:hypothetical protein